MLICCLERNDTHVGVTAVQADLYIQLVKVTA